MQSKIKNKWWKINKIDSCEVKVKSSVADCVSDSRVTQRQKCFTSFLCSYLFLMGATP